MKKLPLEKEVEDAFFEYIQQINPIWQSIYKQVVLPLGIADIVGLCTSGHVSVIEVKREKIDRKTIGQLIGYIGQIDCTIKMLANNIYIEERFRADHQTYGYVVGKSIDKDAMSACRALGYTVYLYDYSDGKITFNEHLEYEDYLYSFVSEDVCSNQLLEIVNGVLGWIRKYAAYEFGDIGFEIKESPLSAEILNDPNTVVLYQRKTK